MNAACVTLLSLVELNSIHVHVWTHTFMLLQNADLANSNIDTNTFFSKKVKFWYRHLTHSSLQYIEIYYKYRHSKTSDLTLRSSASLLNAKVRLPTEILCYYVIYEVMSTASRQRQVDFPNRTWYTTLITLQLHYYLYLY